MLLIADTILDLVVSKESAISSVYSSIHDSTCRRYPVILSIIVILDELFVGFLASVSSQSSLSRFKYLTINIFRWINIGCLSSSA